MLGTYVGTFVKFTAKQYPGCPERLKKYAKKGSIKGWAYGCNFKMAFNN